jgi:hypothetical protein
MYVLAGLLPTLSSWLSISFSPDVATIRMYYQCIVLVLFLLTASLLPISGSARRPRKLARILFGLATLLAIWIFVDPNVVSDFLGLLNLYLDPTQKGVYLFWILSTLGLLVLLMLQVPHWRTYWPEAWLIFLILFMRAVWLLPRPDDMATNSSTAALTPSASVQRAVFALPTSKIASDLVVLGSSPRLLVILVPAVDQATPPAGREGKYDADFLDVADIDRLRLQPPYHDAFIVRVMIERGQNDLLAVNFARDLSNAEAIYLLPEP